MNPTTLLEGLKGLSRGFRRKVWADFMIGTATAMLRRKYSLTQSVVEAIIRENMRMK